MGTTNQRLQPTSRNEFTSSSKITRQNGYRESGVRGNSSEYEIQYRQFRDRC